MADMILAASDGLTAPGNGESADRADRGNREQETVRADQERGGGVILPGVAGE
jgi:hypothetical protein